MVLLVSLASIAMFSCRVRHSERVLAIVCPGQGSQTPGFLNPWLEVPGTAERLETFSAAAETDLRTHGTTSDADTIRDTAVAQPLIVAASLLFGTLAHGGLAVNALVPKELIEVLQAVIILAVATTAAVEAVRVASRSRSASWRGRPIRSRCGLS